jgi:hypothetical protein
MFWLRFDSLYAGRRTCELDQENKGFQKPSKQLISLTHDHTFFPSIGSMWHKHNHSQVLKPVLE